MVGGAYGDGVGSGCDKVIGTVGTLGIVGMLDAASGGGGGAIWEAMGGGANGWGAGTVGTEETAGALYPP